MFRFDTDSASIYVRNVTLTAVSCPCSSIHSWALQVIRQRQRAKMWPQPCLFGFDFGVFCWVGCFFVVFVWFFCWFGFFFFQMEAILGIQVQVNWTRISIFIHCLLV